MRQLLAAISVLLCVACAPLKENYSQVGFNSMAEYYSYYPNHAYYGSRLSGEDWAAFRRQFPEFWNTKESLSLLFATPMDYPEWYSTYAFKWTSLQREKTWDAATVARLSNGQIQPGDDIFQVIKAMGPPNRVVWTNQYEILLYNNDTAIVMNDSHYRETLPCKNCAEWPDQSSGRGLSDREIAEKLELQRAAK